MNSGECRTHKFPTTSSAPWINCEDYMTKNPLTLTKKRTMGRSQSIYICPHFIFIIFIIFIFNIMIIWPSATLSLSLSLSCDADFWTRHVGIFKVAISIEACRINQEAKVFSGGVDDCQVKYCSNTSSVRFCSGIHLFGPTNLIANGPKIFTLKETSKGHLVWYLHGLGIKKDLLPPTSLCINHYIK